MKFKITIFFFLISILSQAQSGIIWEPAIDVAPGSFDNLRPRIATDRHGNPMVIWGKGSTKTVNFSRWDTITAAFTNPIVVNPHSLSAFVMDWAGAEMASFGDTVYVVFKVTPEDTNHVYVSCSYDAGNSFNQPVQVDYFVDSVARFPTITVDAIGNPVVAYMKFETGFINPGYAVSRSNDHGVSFMPDVSAGRYSGGEACDCCPGSIVTSGNMAAMLYRDNLNNQRTMWAGLSTDNCLSFPAGMPIDQTGWMVNACPSSGPDGIIIGDSLYSVFMSGATGDARCYFNASSLSQMISGSDNPFTGFLPGLSNQNYPRIAHEGNKVGYVCRQSVNGTDQLPLFYTEDITTTQPVQNYDTVANGVIANAEIAMTHDAVFIVWQDDNSGTVKFRKGTLPNTTTSVKNISNEIEVSVFPSPAIDFFWINSNSPVKSVEMFDATGRIVRITTDLTSNGAVCHFNTSNGIHNVKILTNDGTFYYQKIIIADN